MKEKNFRKIVELKNLKKMLNKFFKLARPKKDFFRKNELESLGKNSKIF